MPSCGSQIILCDLPIRFDTYKGCSHACKYCFVSRKTDISKISTYETINSLKSFIQGKRNQMTNWCDWNIPLHWGGMSDPFQPIELRLQSSFNALKVFADTYYPFVVSTKGTSILARSEYLDLLKQCNAVVQVSLIAPVFDRLEPGAPPFEQRLKDISVISRNCKRVIIRIQPYIREALPSILSNLSRYKQAGVYGVTIEGIKYFQKRAGFIKVGGDFCYPKDVLFKDFSKIKAECNKIGLHFFCAENRLRSMGEALCCCGINGLDGFVGFEANLIHFLKEGNFKFTQNMKKEHSLAFKALAQDTLSNSFFKKNSFANVMKILANDKKILNCLR